MGDGQTAADRQTGRAKWTDGGGQTDRASHKHRLSVAHYFEINYFVTSIESLSHTIAHATVDIYIVKVFTLFLTYQHSMTLIFLQLLFRMLILLLPAVKR